MERVFKKDIGRFKKGDSRNYPQPVWEGIAKSAKQALTDITISADELKELNSQDPEEKEKEIEKDEQSKGTTTRGTAKGASKND